MKYLYLFAAVLLADLGVKFFLNSSNIELWKNAIEKLRNSENREIIANQAKEDFYKYTWKNRAKLIF